MFLSTPVRFRLVAEPRLLPCSHLLNLSLQNWFPSLNQSISLSTSHSLPSEFEGVGLVWRYGQRQRSLEMRVFKSYFTPTGDGTTEKTSALSHSHGDVDGTKVAKESAGGLRLSNLKSKNPLSSALAPQSSTQSASISGTNTLSAHTGTPSQSRPSSILTPSVRNSVYPRGDFRNSQQTLMDVKNDMMVNWLYEQQMRKLYVFPENIGEGVVLKRARGDFTCCPPQLRAFQGGFYDMIVKMNVRVCTRP